MAVFQLWSRLISLNLNEIKGLGNPRMSAEILFQYQIDNYETVHSE
jgi:hypothetical protein